MNVASSSQKYKLNRMLRIILVLAMSFAAWHVTSHEVDFSGEASGHEECQLCLLSHTPTADFPTFTWFVPLLILSLIMIVPDVHRFGQPLRYILGARAPPIF